MPAVTRGSTDESFPIGDEHLIVRTWQDDGNPRQDGLIELCIGMGGRISLWASDSRVAAGADVVGNLRAAADALERVLLRRSPGAPEPPQLPAHGPSLLQDNGILSGLLADLERRGVDGEKWLASVVKRHGRRVR